MEKTGLPKPKTWLRPIEMAEDVLGSISDARKWMSTPNRSLGGVSPAEFVVAETGEREVEDLLGRIAHGVAA